MMRSRLMFLLHAHLPYIRHQGEEILLEERWLFEALSECYLPIARILNGMREDKLPFHITFSLTPPLCEMLGDEHMMRKYSRHLDSQLLLAAKEKHRLADQPDMMGIARFYEEHLLRCREFFHSHNRDLLGFFRELRDGGHITIVTCAATHGFLPNLRFSAGAVEAQLEAGARNFEKHFGTRPRGIWLSECGFFPDLETCLADVGLEYFFTDTHALLQAHPLPDRGAYEPVRTPMGLVCFARDPASSREVWSAEEGYPSDGRYREFYWDIGHNLPLDYLGAHIDSAGIRVDTGFKYCAIGYDPNHKPPYERHQAMEAVREHAHDFLNKRREQHRILAENDRGPASILCPYDAELFGHWWFEGPEFLEQTLRLATNDDELELAGPESYLGDSDKLVEAAPGFSSWGDGGYAQVWLNEKNDWIYPVLHEAGWKMHHAALEKRTGKLSERIRNQMARELLLAQSSDWAFIMNAGTAVDYATRRTRDHLDRFFELIAMLRSRKPDTALLESLEKLDPIFSELDFRIFGNRWIP